MMKRIFVILMAIAMAVISFGCSEADKVNYNLSQQADHFECERRITVYNARTDMVVLIAEGYMSIDNNSANLKILCVPKIISTFR